MLDMTEIYGRNTLSDGRQNCFMANKFNYFVDSSVILCAARRIHLQEYLSLEEESMARGSNGNIPLSQLEGPRLIPGNREHSHSGTVTMEKQQQLEEDKPKVNSESLEDLEREKD